MRSRVFQTSVGPATLRQLEPADEPNLIALGQSCAPLVAAWSGDQVRSQLQTFSEGQCGVEVAGRLVGSSSSLIVHLGRDSYRHHSHLGITDDGHYRNHDAEGDTLYLVQVNVAPEWRRRGIGTELIGSQVALCRRLNLRRVLFAVPLGRRVGAASLERELERVQQGAASEPEFVVSSKLGFGPRAVLRGYSRVDGESTDAVLMEWINDEYSPTSSTPGWVRVALVQYQLRAVEAFEDFARQVEYFVQAARGYNADFVLFPEFTSMQLLSSPALRNLSPEVAVKAVARQTQQVFGLFSALARRHRLHIIGGSHPVEVSTDGQSRIQNVCPVALPDGRVLMQPKLHITPSETDAWGIRGGAHLAVIPTPKAKIGVLICYDSEFPEAARYLADQGLDILFVPYCTDDRQGHLRVRLCCQARAIENQIYVAAAGVIGNLPCAAGMDVHYGRAAVFTPSDFTFGRDGIQAEADPNVETLLVTDLDLGNLYRARETGSVRPRLDRRPDLFTLTTNFAASELPEYPLAESSDGAQ